MIMYSINKYRGKEFFLKGIVDNGKSIKEGYLMEEANIIRKKKEALYGSKKVEFKDIKLEEIIKRVKKLRDKYDDIIVIDRAIAYLLKENGENIKLLDISRVYDLENDKTSVEKRPLQIPEILKGSKIKLNGKIEREKKALVVDIGSYSGETLEGIAEKLKRRYGKVDILVAFSTYQSLKKLKGKVNSFISLSSEEVEDWIEVRDINFIGRYMKYNKEDYLLPYLYFPKAASIDEVEIATLLYNSYPLRYKFSEDTGIYSFPYSAKGDKVMNKLMFIDFDGTVLPEMRFFNRFLLEVSKEASKYNIKNSWEGVMQGKFESRREYFERVWGEAIKTKRGREMLIRYLEENLKEVENAYRVMEEKKRKGWIPILLTDGPSVYVKYMLKEIEKRVGKYAPLYLIITTDNTDLFTEKKKSPTEPILNSIYYRGMERLERLKVVLFDDNITTEWRYEKGKEEKRERSTDKKLVERMEGIE